MSVPISLSQVIIGFQNCLKLFGSGNTEQERCLNKLANNTEAAVYLFWMQTDTALFSKGTLLFRECAIGTEGMSASAENHVDCLCVFIFFPKRFIPDDNVVKIIRHWPLREKVFQWNIAEELRGTRQSTILLY